jgi:hypothetical protein
MVHHFAVDRHGGVTVSFRSSISASTRLSKGSPNAAPGKVRPLGLVNLLESLGRDSAYARVK